MKRSMIAVALAASGRNWVQRSNEQERAVFRIVAAAGTRSRLLLRWLAHVKQKCAGPTSTPPTWLLVRDCGSLEAAGSGPGLSRGSWEYLTLAAGLRLSGSIVG